eukprot:TRINITY_DN29132_c0_g1_i2.p1 TRINITY_DN29132_c0_g1~~TRINITY_DN29132_c0_g1_i2.p1  ORF type:complete len:253 (-),score=61.73 TRINITY_DN29132_c0_g1_i2:173-832(-)
MGVLAAAVLAAGLSCAFVARGAQTLRPPSAATRIQRAAEEASTRTESFDKRTLTNIEILSGTGYDDAEVDALVKRISQSTADEIWNMTNFPPLKRPEYLKEDQWVPVPDEKRWLDLQQFRRVVDGFGTQYKPATVEIVFNSFTAGAAFVEKYKVADALSSWKDGGFQVSLLGTRLMIAFSYGWLYGMSTFCGYFFFFRPPLDSYLGIDLLPGIPKWWLS